MDRQAEAAILATSFEPYGDGYIFYLDRSSGGVSVSAKERQAYLAMTGIIERHQWTKMVGQRAVVGPLRDTRLASRRLRATIPVSLTIYSCIFAAIFTILAVGVESPIWLRIIFAFAAIFLTGSAIANILARRKAG